MSSVLILTHPEDAHADAVATHLRDAAVEICRLDTAALGADLPLVARLGGEPATGTLAPGAIAGGAAVAGAIAGVDLTRVGCVWHRRPSEPATQDEVAAAEIRAAVGGVLAALPHLNHPADMAAAALKPYQLAVAAGTGLRVPETIVGTSADSASELAARHRGRVVVKPLSRRAAGFVTAADRAGWSRPAHLTQQRIDKAYDVRLTVVDRRQFAIRIESPHLDWRAEPARCRYEVTRVPEQVGTPVARLMERLRLRFAALDFAVDAAGRWWFLEVNPNGQWLWLEESTGVPISAAIAAALTAPPPHRPLPPP